MAVTRGKAKPPKRRRSAELSRREILDVAEKQLRAHGPDAIRLQDVAREAGMSHPTLLYHFGSRDELVEAVVARAFESLQAELVGAFKLAEIGVDETLSMLDRAFQILGERGFARLLAWLLLTGAKLPPGTGLIQLETVAKAAHSQRKRRLGATSKDYDDTVFTTLLAALVTFAEGVAGDALRASAGLANDPAAAQRFRLWFAQLLVERMEDTRKQPKRKRKH